VVTSGYFCTFRDSIMDRHHCMDHYVPGLGRLAEMSDVAALIAPNAFMAETGTEDEGFPVQAVRRAFARLKRAYEMMGVGERCHLHVFHGDHHWEGVRVWQWLRAML